MMKILKFYLLIFIMITFSTLSCASKNENQTVMSDTLAMNNAKTEISVEKIEKLIEKGKDVTISNALIKGKLDFTLLSEKYIESVNSYRTEISSNITFMDCVFEDEVVAQRKDGEITYRTNFQKNVTFINCKFEKEIVLRQSNIFGLVNFTGSFFKGDANFEGINFVSVDVYFTECIFKEAARFQNTMFSGNVNFLKTEFYKEANFQQTTVKRDAQFGACVFVHYIDFGNAFFQGNFLANYAEFNRRAFFNNVRFMSRAEFIDCKFKEISEFKNSLFYGFTSFKNSKITGQFTIDESAFILGKPNTENIQISENSVISEKGSRFFVPQVFETGGFLKNGN